MVVVVTQVKVEVINATTVIRNNGDDDDEE